jgi:outer membrane biosynthesis protein TonB
MSLARICDRSNCNNVILKGVEEVQADVMVAVTGPDGKTWADLCDNCRADLLRWLGGTVFPEPATPPTPATKEQPEKTRQKPRKKQTKKRGPYKKRKKSSPKKRPAKARTPKTWTKQEKDWLKKNRTLPMKEKEKRLKRPPTAIYQKMSTLGLKSK